MLEYGRRFFAWAGVRFLLGVALFWAGFHLIFAAAADIMAIAFILPAMALFLLGAAIMAPPIAALVARPAASLFFPDERYPKPPPMYGIAESQAQKGNYEEAIALYEDIAARHPREVQPHVAMIEIAVVRLHDLARADAFFRAGMKALRGEEERKELCRIYDAVRSRLNPPTAWNRDEPLHYPNPSR